MNGNRRATVNKFTSYREFECGMLLRESFGKIVGAMCDEIYERHQTERRPNYNLL